MSDYLWDKTGEPDAEVEQLEQLLGALAHRPRPLELPAAARTEQAAPRRAGMTRPSLAVAAALALLLLAGAWLFASRRASSNGQTAHSPATPTPRSAVRDGANAAGGKERAAESGPQTNDGPAGRDLKQRPSHQQSAHASPPPRRRRGVVQASAAPSRKSRNAAAREERPREDLLAAVMERQQSAKAQLVYALRLTGAKLSEVQTKVRGVSGERPAPEERNKIR